MDVRITDAVLNGRRVDIDIEAGRIAAIRVSGSYDRAADEPEQVVDAAGNWAVPSLKNGHTHAAMTLLRGFADDMKLKPWLEQIIWPAEGRLEPEDIYWGTRLAALEMIKSGTTFCNDMYLHFDESWRAYSDAGIKAGVGAALFDFFQRDTAAQVRRNIEELYQRYGAGNDLLRFVPAPHALYTVSEETLRWLAEFTAEADLPVHIHLSETEDEVNECRASHGGLRPAEYLDRVGLLSPRLIAAHAIWLSEEEIKLLADRGVTVVHNPVSNMKLASGSCFPYRALKEAGVPMMLGTDGCSSNNNLDMFEEMKIAALLQKHHFGDTELMSAEEILQIASGGVAKLFPNIAGELTEGAPADLLLIDTQRPEMTPAYNPASNLVYAGGGAAVDTVISGGRMLMAGRQVPGEEEILAMARERARLLRQKSGR